MSSTIKDERYNKALEYFKMKKIPTIEEIESARFLKEKKIHYLYLKLMNVMKYY